MNPQRRLPLRLPIRHAPMPVPPRKGALYQDNDPEKGWPAWIVDSARGAIIRLRCVAGEGPAEDQEWTRAEWRAAGLELVRAVVPAGWQP